MRCYNCGQELPEPTGENKAIGTGKYFALFCLFAIPIVGWCVCLYMLFAEKDENLRNLARAVLIWKIIRLVISLVTFFVTRWLIGVIMSAITESLGGLGGLEGLEGLLNGL